MRLQEDPEPFDLTFGFVVGKLVVGEAKPSLLEVLHSKPVSPLCSLYHKSEEEWVGDRRVHVSLKTSQHFFFSLAQYIPYIRLQL